MAKRTRRLLVFGLIACLLALGAGFWLLWPRRSAITLENIENVNYGMTRAEVETLLCGPARNESSERHHEGIGDPSNIWIGDEAAVELSFRDGRVRHIRVTRWSREPLAGRLRRWLRL